MYKELSKILICPECNGELILSIIKEEDDEVIEGELSCNNNHDWIIKEGVINFGSKEQELSNNWEEMYEHHDYEELDEKISKRTSENMKQINNNAKDFIINKLNSSKDIKTILDIATGRGMLLTELSKKLKIDSQLICTDLSFDVLKYDRLKAKNINRDIRVNYIACDAAKLPIKENSIDLCVSFHGIANMMDKIPCGIAEAKRVLKENKLLLNSGIVIKENSEGYKEIKAWLNSQGTYGVERFFTEIGFREIHKAADFRCVDIVTIAEDIADKCEYDLIPYECEWFSVVVTECQK